MANPILPHPNMDFTPLDVLTAAELDQMVANIQYLTNFCKGLANGSNLDNGSVLPSKLNTTISDTDSAGWRYKAIENTYYKNIVNQPSVSLSSSGVSGDTKELWSTVPPAGFSDFSKFEIQCTALMSSGSGVVLRWQGGADRLKLFARNTANYPNQDTGSWHAYIRLVKAF